MLARRQKMRVLLRKHIAAAKQERTLHLKPGTEHSQSLKLLREHLDLSNVADGGLRPAPVWLQRACSKKS